jgi:hypothetical protein
VGLRLRVPGYVRDLVSDQGAAYAVVPAPLVICSDCDHMKGAAAYISSNSEPSAIAGDANVEISRARAWRSSLTIESYGEHSSTCHSPRDSTLIL